MDFPKMLNMHTFNHYISFLLALAIFTSGCSSEDPPEDMEQGPLIAFSDNPPYLSMDTPRPAGSSFSVLITDTGEANVVSLEVQLDGQSLLPFEFFLNGLTPGGNPLTYTARPYFVSDVLGFIIPGSPGVYTYSFIATDINNHTEQLDLQITAE